MDTSPNSQLDVLSQDVAKLKQDVSLVLKRFQDFDVTILKILQTFKRGEEAFELRVSRVLRNVLGGIVENLDHSIDSTAEAISQLERGFDVFPVDGVNVKENEKTISVTKGLDGSYNYALASDPDCIMNDGTEPFNTFFNNNPDLFKDRDTVLVNIIAYTTMKKEVEDGVS